MKGSIFQSSNTLHYNNNNKKPTHLILKQLLYIIMESLFYIISNFNAASTNISTHTHTHTPHLTQITIFVDHYYYIFKFNVRRECWTVPYRFCWFCLSNRLNLKCSEEKKYWHIKNNALTKIIKIWKQKIKKFRSFLFKFVLFSLSSPILYNPARMRFDAV